MLTYLLRRLFYLVPTLFLIAVVSFLIIRLAPGDPAKQFEREGGDVASKSEQVASENVEEFRRLYGLDRPLPEQFVRWLKRLILFDFGRSIIYKNEKVSTLLADRVVTTMQIQVLAILLIYCLSIPAGIVLAVRENTVTDRVLTLVLFVLYSLPAFFIAILLLTFFANTQYWALFPSRGLNDPDLPGNVATAVWLADRVHHLILPVLVTAIGGLAYLAMQMRGNMLEVLRQQYIVTARSKGLTERKVVLKHALRNSMIPIVTIVSSVLPFLVGGSVIVEYVFQIQGMGQLAFEAILQRDYNVIMATTVISAVLTLLGILISDMLYVIVDPRITFD
jgi:peptide/nickel transport system permease protein